VRAWTAIPLALAMTSLSLSLNATGADPAGYTFDTVVDVVEPLGSEILLDVKSGSNSLVARVEPTVRVKVHEGVRLALNPDRLHFFDMTSEKAI